MAEFRFVMRQRRRMCDTADGKCDGCALQGMDCGISAMSSNPDEYEDRILQWAAEHPEPVYPTWEQFIAKMYLRSGRVKYHNIKEWEINEHIPADIAQKLGIEPEEKA